MNILVTGATGFIGTACVSALLSQGHTIYALSRQNGPVLNGSHQNLNLLNADLRNADLEIALPRP